jgi:CRP-like cAMP-binding protein
MSKEVKGFEAEHRIMVLLNYIKKRDSADKEPFQITMTRQTIANLTGLRVETVIRTIKKLEKEGKRQIIDKKLFL